MWIVSFEITDKNSKEIIYFGRQRWRIENEGFNIQKNGTFDIEHIYSQNLKGQREILWRKYNKSTNQNDKNNILKDINQLTEKIDIAHAQKNACIRIIDKYAQLKEDYKNEIESKNKAVELIKEDKKKKLRYR